MPDFPTVSPRAVPSRDPQPSPLITISPPAHAPRRMTPASLHRVIWNSGQLAEDAGEKERVVPQIPLRRGGAGRSQAEKPFQAAALHPARAPAAAARRENRKAAPTPKNRVASSLCQYWAMNFSCFGVLSPTQKMSGLSASSRRARSCSSSAVSGGRGGEAPTILQSGEPLLQAALKRFRHARGAAIQKMSAAARLGAAAHPQHQVRAIDPPHLPEPCQRPIQTMGMPSGVCEKRSVEDGAKGGVAPGFADPMHAGHANVALVLLLERLATAATARVQVDGADAHAQDIRARSLLTCFSWPTQ